MSKGVLRGFHIESPAGIRDVEVVSLLGDTFGAPGVVAKTLPSIARLMSCFFGSAEL